MKVQRRIFAALLSLFLLSGAAYGQNESRTLPKLIVFHSPACHRCNEVKKDVLPGIENEFRGRITLEYRDLIDINNYTYLLSLKEKYAPELDISLPVFFFEGKLINGRGNVQGNLRQLLLTAVSGGARHNGSLGIDLVEFFKRFNLLGITIAGLQDGINPCAFTVIVFFISYLVLQGYRRREVIAIGLTFLGTVFVTYLLIGLGIFNFLYALKSFWIISRILNISIGVLSVGLGLLAFYDFLKFRKEGKPEGQILQLPKAVKDQIHGLIGLHYRKSRDGQAQPQAVSLPRLILSALITGFLVTLLEAVCTGQIYLPTITFILKTTPLKLQAFLYLVYYNLLFVMPLFVIFILALLGVTSAQFASFLKKRLALIKILMAILFLGLGAFLIWRG